jgi:beta-lactamase regulating signal transducer with metallopeptidase domain
MSLSDFFFFDHVVYALSMGLLHSLWQGVIVFLSVYILSPVLKSSDSRYKLVSAGLLLLFVLFVSTFLAYTNSNSRFDTDLIVVKENVASLGNVRALDVNEGLPGVYSETWISYIDKVCILWFCGVMVMILRLVWALFFVNRIRANVSPLSNPTLDKIMFALQGRLKLSKNVVLNLSEVIRGPLTVGWLKPIILLPVAVVNGLSLSQLELIIAHELAHIKRNDYLVNILQSLAEALLFFNPFVWLISGKIRAEREHCCDDIALELCGGDRVALVKTLVAVADMSNLPRLSMGMGKRDSLFIVRIKRILNMERKQTFKLGQFVALLGILFISAGSFLYATETLDSGLQSKSFNQKDSSLVLESERDSLLIEVRELRKEVELNSVELPGIVIRGDKSNQNVLSDLEGQVAAYSPKLMSEEEKKVLSIKSATNDELWREIEKRDQRLGEIESIRKAAFEANFRAFWMDIDKFVRLEEVNEINLKDGVLYINSLAQSNEKYREVLNVFERHFLKEAYLDLNKHVKNKELGLSRFRETWSLALPGNIVHGKTGTSYWSLKDIQP